MQSPYWEIHWVRTLPAALIADFATVKPPQVDRGWTQLRVLLGREIVLFHVQTGLDVS